MHRALGRARMRLQRATKLRITPRWKKLQSTKKEMEVGWESATGANKAAFFKELGNADPEIAQWSGLSTGDTTTARENYVSGAAGWSTDEQKRGWRTVEKQVTRGDIANTKAQGARRPNASELD